MLVQVNGKVVGKQRPRVTRHGTYTPKETKEYEKKIADAWRELGVAPFEGPVEVTVFVERKMPDSRPKKLLSEPDIYKPDADNILKVVQDALNGVAYLDDKYVVDAFVKKLPRRRKEEDTLIVRVGEVSYEG